MYHAVPVELSQQHIKKLAEGQSVKLSHENLSGDAHTIHLTTSQARRYMKALNSNKSLTLKFSARQLKHNMKQSAQTGSGLWDSLRDFAKTNVLPVAKDLAKDLAKKGVDAGADQLKGLIDRKIGKGLLGGSKGKRIMPVVMPVPIPANDDRVVVVPNKLDLLVHQPMSVMGQKPVAQLQEGSGFFDDLGSFIGDTAKMTRNAAVGGLYNRISGRGVKPRGRPKKATVGGSFTLHP